jgi:hypothetical protein
LYFLSREIILAKVLQQKVEEALPIEVKIVRSDKVKGNATDFKFVSEKIP